MVHSCRSGVWTVYSSHSGKRFSFPPGKSQVFPSSVEKDQKAIKLYSDISKKLKYSYVAKYIKYVSTVYNHLQYVYICVLYFVVV